MADKNKNSMGITPPINTNNNKIPSLQDLMHQDDQYTNSEQTVFVDPDNNSYRFRLRNIIGASPHDKLHVYKASYMALDNEMYKHLTSKDMYVAMKFVDIKREPDVCWTLRRQVDLNGLVPDHQNLVGIRAPFIINKGYFCVVFPFMAHGSLRKIVSTRCPNGLHEDYAVLALKETLTGLSIIHGSGHVHREINAGRIFFNGTPVIKLAFSASIYDENQEDQALSSSSKYLQSDSICKWGAAPEVYGSDNKEYTPKADIWLIGITALELAYGGVKVENREELKAKVKKINKKKKLPRGGFDGCSKLRKNKFTSWIGEVFSKGFQRMVVRCLAWRPEERPSADELLQDEVFAEKDYDSTLLLFHKMLKLATETK